MTNHVLQCTCCPEEVVRTLKAYKASHPGQIRDLPKGSKTKFVSIVWERLFEGTRVVENPEPHLNSEHTSNENSSSYLESVAADSDLAVGQDTAANDRAKPDEASHVATYLVGDESDERCRSENEAKSKTSQTEGLPLVIKAAGDREEEKREEENPSNNTIGNPPNKETEDNGIAAAGSSAPAVPSKRSGTLTTNEADPKSSISRSDHCIPENEVESSMLKCAQIDKKRKENVKSDLSQKRASEAEGEVSCTLTTTAVSDLDGLIAESSFGGTSPQTGCDLPETSKHEGASDTVKLSDGSKKGLNHDGQLSDIPPDKDDNSNADHEQTAPDNVHGMIGKSHAPEPTLTKTYDLASAPHAPALKDAKTQLRGDTVDGENSKTEVETHDSNAMHTDDHGQTESDSQDWYSANKSAFNQMSEFAHGRSTSNPRIDASAVEPTSSMVADGLSLLSNLADSRPRLKETPKPDDKTEILDDSSNRNDEMEGSQQLGGKQCSFETCDKHENQSVTADHPRMDEGPAQKDNYTNNVSPLHSEPERKRPRKRKKSNTSRGPTGTSGIPAGTDFEPEAKDTGTEPNFLHGVDKGAGTGTADNEDVVFICPTCDKAFKSMSSLKKHHGGAHRSKVNESKVKVGLVDGSGAIRKRFDSIEDLDRYCGLASSHRGHGIETPAKLAAVPAVRPVASGSKKERGRKRKQSSNDTAAPPAATASDSAMHRGRKRKQSSNKTAELPSAPDSKKKRGRQRKSQSSERSSSRSDTLSPDATKHVDGGSRPSKRSYRKQQGRADTEKEFEGMKYPINSRVIIWADNDYWGATIKGYERKRNTIGYSVNYDGYAKSRRNWVEPRVIAGLMNAEGKLVLDD